MQVGYRDFLEIYVRLLSKADIDILNTDQRWRGLSIAGHKSNSGQIS